MKNTSEFEKAEKADSGVLLHHYDCNGPNTKNAPYWLFQLAWYIHAILWSPVDRI